MIYLVEAVTSMVKVVTVLTSIKVVTSIRHIYIYIYITRHSSPLSSVTSIPDKGIERILNIICVKLPQLGIRKVVLLPGPKTFYRIGTEIFPAGSG